MTTPIETALQEGYSQDEINAFLSDRARVAREQGYSDQEVNSFIQEHVLQTPEFNQTPLRAQGDRALAPRPSPKTLLEAIETGWGWSATALGREALKGKDAKLPSMELNDDTETMLRLAGKATGVVADIPSMIAGGILGSGGGPMGTLGGAFAMPMGLRKVFLDAIEEGTVGTKKDFVDKAIGTIWETAKGWMTGASTAFVGGKAIEATAAMPGIVKAVVPTVAEIATMTEVGARLEGHAPNPTDFLDNGVLLGVAKMVTPGQKPPKVMRETYEKTGVTPDQMVNDALKEPAIWQDILDGRVPEAYKEKVEVSESPETQAKRSESPKTPEMDADQQARARAFMENPWGEIPQAPNEPRRPGHINYNRIQTTEEASHMLARLSEIYEAQIREKQLSPRAWAKSEADAAKVLGDLLNAPPEKVLQFVSGDTDGPSITAQLYARKEIMLGFTEDVARARAALMAKGDARTPEDVAKFYALVERVAQAHRGFLGQSTDVGRALNILKNTKRLADKSQAVLDYLNEKGGEQKLEKVLDMVGEFERPEQVVEFAKKFVKATTWEMVVEAWKAGLVSGLRTNEVNFLSTAAFSILKLPVEAIAAVHGTLGKTEDRVQFAEIPARMMGMMAGMKDGAKVAGAVLRTGENVIGEKTDSTSPKIPGKVGEVARVPFRLLGASDAFFKTVNERGQLYADATHQAMAEGVPFGSEAFWNRVVTLVKQPTEAMQEAAKDAAERYTFTKQLGKGGQAFQRVVKEWHLEWLFPFITTPGNIFKETARMTPGLNFAVKEWRDAWEKGGRERDRAVAEVTVGGMIMATVVAAALEGAITGNGQPDKRLRATDRAAGWKPYALKIGTQYYDGYLRMAPIGPLVGLTADATEFWDYMTHEERDQWARMLAFAFAQNVTNQTFMTGMTNFVNVMQDPSRYGENYFESLAGSVVPSIIGQTAADMDPLQREIHGMREAMLARIPYQREGLMPKRDLFGAPIASPERLWWGSPFTVSSTSVDKVRTEAAKIGFATPDIPKTLDVVPGKRFGTLDKVQLTPEQRDVFASLSGQMAHQELTKIVNAPGWDEQPAMIKRQTYEKVFKASRDAANKLLLAGTDPKRTDEAVNAIQREMRKP